MNKAELITALADRLGGDQQLATDALENLLDIIVRTVESGESITIMGFGIFEKRARAARVARNPHTGESIPVAPTYSPVFRPGQHFKSVVQGTTELPEGRLAAKRASSHRPFAGRGRAETGAAGSGQSRAPKSTSPILRAAAEVHAEAEYVTRRAADDRNALGQDPADETR